LIGLRLIVTQAYLILATALGISPEYTTLLHMLDLISQ